MTVSHQFSCESLWSHPIWIVVPHVAVARDEVAEKGIEEKKAEEDSEAVYRCDKRFFVICAIFAL